MSTVSTDVDLVDEYATCFTKIQFLICLNYFSIPKSTWFLSVFNHSICELCSRCAFYALSKPVHDKMIKTWINSWKHFIQFIEISFPSTNIVILSRKMVLRILENDQLDQMKNSNDIRAQTKSMQLVKLSAEWWIKG